MHSLALNRGVLGPRRSDRGPGAARVTAMEGKTMTKRGDDSHKPYVSNYPPLQEWLEKHGASCLWQEMSTSQAIEGWLVGQVVAIIVVQSGLRGWDIYTPCRYTEIETTLADAERRLGLAP
jgi:hypothetical protein